MSDPGPDPRPSPSSPSPAAAVRLGEAWSRLKRGEAGPARRLLEALIREEPALAPPRELLAYALQMQGDLDGAEREMRAAAGLDPAQPAYAAGLAAILRSRGRDAEARALLQAALVRAPDFAPAQELLAAAQEDAGEFAAAEATTRRALARRPEDLEAWRRLARVRQAQGDLAGAEESLAHAARLAPADAEVQAALADCIWMRTGDLAAALAPIEAALRLAPTVSLFATKIRLAGRAGQAGEAYAEARAAADRDPANGGLQGVAAAAAANAGRAEDMLAHARAMQAARPEDAGADRLAAEALLRLGRADQAAALLEGLVAGSPLDQGLLALAALAWRFTGDPRYAALHDYDRVVRTFEVEPPPGWRDREALLAAAAERLHELHGLHRAAAHPLDQSLRGGVQTSHDLYASHDPVLQALFAALQAPIARYVDELGPGGDPLRRRRRTGFRIAGAWSVRLQAGGFHVSHVHPDGWISSAFYLETPPSTGRESREGWLQFGDPGFPLAAPAPAEHFVEPKPGRLVLFPSYMFHGTVPFSAPQPRLTVAFDVLPT